MRIEMLPAAETPHLRSGYAFVVYAGADIVSDGRIKPDGRVIFARGSRPPSRPARAALYDMAKNYAAGEKPSRITDLDEATPAEVDDVA